MLELLRNGSTAPTGLAASLVARRTGAAADAAGCSRPESLVRYWLIDGGLPVPGPQVPSTTGGGARSRTAISAIPSGRCSSSTRAGSTPNPDQFGLDVDRYSLMAADGWLGRPARRASTCDATSSSTASGERCGAAAHAGEAE